MSAAGRKARPAPPQVDVELNHEALGKAQAARDELVVLERKAAQNATEMAQFLGYDGPLQPEVLEHAIRQQMRRTAEACLEMGRMLLLLKESLAHGEFEPRLEALGMSPRAARKFMQSAFKFANRPTSAVLTKAVGTQNKLLELLVLDDEEVAELADGKSVRGVALDKIACMSVMELREAFRESEERHEAKDKLIEQKNAKIDKLLTGKKFKPSPDAIAQTEAEQAQLTALDETTQRAGVVFVELANVVAAIMRPDGDDSRPPSKAMRGRAQQAVQFIVQRLVDVIDDYGIEIELAGPMDSPPEDMGQIRTAGKSARH